MPLYIDGQYGRQAACAVTPELREAFDRLNLPRLGEWPDSPGSGAGGLAELLRTPAAKYPEQVRPNTVYWPTHGGAFAFCWVLVGNSQLWHAEYNTSAPILSQPWPLTPPPVFTSGPAGTPGGSPTASGGTGTDSLVGGSGGAAFYPDPMTGVVPWSYPGALGPPTDYTRVNRNQPFYSGAGLHWLTDGPTAPRMLYTASMSPLRVMAVLVAEYPTGEAVWAVPFVDWRYFQNRTERPLPTVFGDQTSFFLRAYGLGFFDQNETGLEARDGTPAVNVQVMNNAHGPPGAVADCLCAYLGRRGLVLPDGWAYAGPPYRPTSTQHVEEAAAAIDAWLPTLNVAEGGVAKSWATPDLPYNVSFPVETQDEGTIPVQVYTTALLPSTGTWLGDSAHPGGTLFLNPHFRLIPRRGFNPNYDPQFTATAQEGYRIAGRLLAWLTRPFQVVVGGMVEPVRSAFVGMYEWRTDEQETVVHGLTSDTAWWGAGGGFGGDMATYYQTGLVLARGVAGDPDTGTRQVLGSGNKIVEALVASRHVSDPQSAGWDSWGVPTAVPGVAPGVVHADTGMSCGSTFSSQAGGYTRALAALEVSPQILLTGSPTFGYGSPGRFLIDAPLGYFQVHAVYYPFAPPGPPTTYADVFNALSSGNWNVGFGLTPTGGLGCMVVSAYNFMCSRTDRSDIIGGYGIDASYLYPGAQVLGGIVVRNGPSTGLAVSGGGTGRATLTSNALLVGQGTSAVGFLGPAVGSGYLLSTDATGAPQLTLLSGAGTINASGVLTIDGGSFA